MALPKILRNFSLYVDGIGYAGRVTEATPPTLSVQTEEFRAGGMDAPAEIDMGLEAMELAFTLAEYDPAVLRKFGLLDQSAVQVALRGAMVDNGTDATPIVINGTGHFKEFDPGNFTAGEATEASFTMGLRYYRLTIDGNVLHEVDVVNMTRIINGVDQLASIRTAIGI
jgi:P2 family phage contractile tail tube protein